MGAGHLREEESNYQEVINLGRYIGPVCRLCKREGEKLFLKGRSCNTEKCAFEKRNAALGKRVQRKQKMSDFGLRLREKQKAKRIYGVLEKQFKEYYKIAAKSKGVTGEILLELLERRLDNVIFRCGFATTRRESRQLIRHGHFLVNERVVDIPSYLVNPNEKVQIKAKDKECDFFKDIIELTKEKEIPPWLEVDKKDLTGMILRIPSREEMGVSLKEQLIVELYSK